MKKVIATKFVKWDIPELKALQDCKAYRLRYKLNSGSKITREEKDWLTKTVIEQGHCLAGVKVMGWLFDFSDVLSRYIVVRPDYGLTMYWAADKTALRRTLYGRILKIIDYDAKH